MKDIRKEPDYQDLKDLLKVQTTDRKQALLEMMEDLEEKEGKEPEDEKILYNAEVTAQSARMKHERGGK
jgi:hypothetical protein